MLYNPSLSDPETVLEESKSNRLEPFYQDYEVMLTLVKSRFC